MKKSVRQNILSLVPSIEVLFLILGLFIIHYGKWTFLAKQNLPNFWSIFLFVIFSDLLFFFWILLFATLLYVLKPSIFIRRLILLVSLFYVGWSFMNTAWLMRSGVQLQPGVIWLMFRDCKELWPFVKPFIVRNIYAGLFLCIMGVIGFIFFLYFLIRPKQVGTVRRYYGYQAYVWLLCILFLLIVRHFLPVPSSSSYQYSVLGFSSHCYALMSALPSIKQNSSIHETDLRQHVKAGTRKVVHPELALEERPNIILVLLESVSFNSTSLDENSGLNTTPMLSRLAREGVHFMNTHVPVTHTTKAFWSILTGSYPAIDADFVEAIPSKDTYEGLPSFLRKLGYRSAFFEMSRGSFECAPGFFNNLGFDWAWFRENMEDASKYVGLVAGDDCVMLDPAFEWASQNSDPFLLMMITSISHEPYDVPKWFGSNDKEPYEKYLQTVRYTDNFIERMYARMKDCGFDKNTLLCIIGDHGTSFRTFRMNQARWNPYEELIRVPWVLHWPGHLEAGTIIEGPSSQLDVTPTLLSLLGFDISNADFEGYDALNWSDSDRKLYFSSWMPNSPLGYIQKNKKVVYWPYIDKIFEYNLVVDPNEENPVVCASKLKVDEKEDILNWQQKSLIKIDPKQYTECLLYDHWQVFSTGDFAGAYYIP